MIKSIFTKIREGEVPGGEIIYQDELVFVLMTIAPHNPGHCLVIPVEEIANFEDVPEETYLHMMRITRALARLERRLYSSPKVAMIAAGMEVEHAHIHIFPLYSEADIAFTSAKHPDFSEVQVEARKLRQAISESPLR
jgi:histidine triad (HIT) family protein